MNDYTLVEYETGYAIKHPSGWWLTPGGAWTSGEEAPEDCRFEEVTWAYLALLNSMSINIVDEQGERQ